MTRSAPRHAATDEIQMTDGLALLVSVVVSLPERPGDSYAGLAELAPLPSRVLELVAAEILDAYNRGEIRMRPTCAEVRDMVDAAMGARDRLAMLRDARRCDRADDGHSNRTARLRRGPRAGG